jgi:DNA-directed RNA polymerase subunit RPC12/RpoP
MKQPTKLNTNKNKNKDIVTIGDEWTGEDRPSYLCSWCNSTLSKLQDAGQHNTTYFCTRCAIEFDPESENLRKESKLIVPNRNIKPAVSTTPGIPDISIRHTPPIRGGFAELQKKGIKIKDYHTTEKE